MERDLRNETLTIRLSAAEIKLINNFRDKRQLVSKGKVSQADAIIYAVKFAIGSIILSK